MIERIERRLKAVGLSASAASTEAGLSIDFIRNMKRGLSKHPSGENLQKLADVLETTVGHLMGFNEHSERADDDLSGNGARYTDDESGDEQGVVRVPSYGFRAGMGGGGVVLDEAPLYHWPVREEYLKAVRLSTADLVSIEVEGDSMSPSLESGDQIMINRKDKNPARGGIFAIFDSDTLVVKRIEKIPGTDPIMLRLISDNPHHNAYDVIADDTAIVGRVVWYARRL
ncbi:XRE family transcriptional regulator [Litorimonas haliclonae]|uniref:XRE family transcriptional regulator n=1 Tax=Litorimonas haliclonae TaxID=2081977 RepID=UPI0039EEAC1E